MKEWAIDYEMVGWVENAAGDAPILSGGAHRLRSRSLCPANRRGRMQCT